MRMRVTKEISSWRKCHLRRRHLKSKTPFRLVRENEYLFLTWRNTAVQKQYIRNTIRMCIKEGDLNAFTIIVIIIIRIL